MPSYGNRDAPGEARTPDPQIANQMLLRPARFDNSLLRPLNLPAHAIALHVKCARQDGTPGQVVQLAAPASGSRPRLQTSGPVDDDTGRGNGNRCNHADPSAS